MTTDPWCTAFDLNVQQSCPPLLPVEILLFPNTPQDEGNHTSQTFGKEHIRSGEIRRRHIGFFAGAQQLTQLGLGANDPPPPVTQEPEVLL